MRITPPNLVGLCLLALLTSCSINQRGRGPSPAPPAPVPQAPPPDLSANYRRSLPAIGSNPGGEFGALSDSEITLSFTPALEWAQGRQQCDDKPLPPRPRVETKPQRQVCRGTAAQIQRCEEQQDAAEARLLAYERERNARLPPPPVQYVKDCYITPGAPEAKGKLQLRAVPLNPSAQSLAAAPILNSITVTSGQEVRIPLPPLDRGQCFALTDASGKAIAVRSGGNIYAFASSSMIAQLNIAAAEENIRQLQIYRDQYAGTSRMTLAALASDPQWNKNQCIAPAQKPLPPQPSGMAWPEATTQAQSYCFKQLQAGLDGPLVIDSVKAREETQYITSFKMHEKNPAACTRKAYEYPEVELQALRMFTSVIPRESERRAVISQLDQCTTAVKQRCGAHLVAWQREVDAIKAEPQAAVSRCNSKVNAARTETQKVESNAEELKDAQSKLAQLRAAAGRGAPTGFVGLGAAACKATIS